MKRASRWIHVILAALILLAHSSVALAGAGGMEAPGKVEEQLEATAPETTEPDAPSTELEEIPVPETSGEADAPSGKLEEGEAPDPEASGKPETPPEELEEELQESTQGEDSEEESPEPLPEYRLSPEENRLIEEYRSLSQREIFFGGFPSPEAAPSLTIVKTGGEEDYTELTAGGSSPEGYTQLTLTGEGGQPVEELEIELAGEAALVQELYTREQQRELGRILDQLEALGATGAPGGALDGESYGRVQYLLEELEAMAPHYSLEAQGLTVLRDSPNPAEGRHHYLLARDGAQEGPIQLVVKVPDPLPEEGEVLKLTASGHGERDEYRLESATLGGNRAPNFRPLGSGRALQSPQFIGPEDIAPVNHLRLDPNMEQVSAGVVEYSGLNGSTTKPDIKILSAKTGPDPEAVKNGMWGLHGFKVHPKIYPQFAGQTVTAVRFASSNKNAANYSRDMNAGWAAGDLSLDTTKMWLKVKYDNAAYFDSDIVDAEVTFKITPMKNVDDRGNRPQDYGSRNYDPILQFSHNLYYGWAWQNVREINIDLVFKKKSGETVQFETCQYADGRGSYFTINSLDPGNNTVGPQFVRPDQNTISGAYVIPGSHILNSFDGGPAFGTQHGYNGGNTPWDGDQPSHPNWSQNAVLFTTANTDHLNFTMGNLMREPQRSAVPRTDFMWASMSTQSFTDHYVSYRDIQVKKTWPDGSGAYHGPVKVDLVKNYNVTIAYTDGPLGRVEKTVEIRDLVADSVNLSQAGGWSFIFHQIPDEASQLKIIEKIYSTDKNQLREDAGAHFPEDVHDDFEILSVFDFSYDIAPLKIPGYSTTITSDVGNGVFNIVSTKDSTTPEGPSVSETLKPNVLVKKQIDFLGDGADNPHTQIEEEPPYKHQLNDLYRLYLTIEGEKVSRELPLDLLFVLDGSSTMTEADMIGENGAPMSRMDAMMNLINQTDLIPNFLEKNQDNRVAFIYFNGSSKQGTITQASKGYTYKKDAHIISGWTNVFSGNIHCPVPTDNYMGTNYQAGLMLAEDLINVSKAAGRRQAMIFISDGVPTFWIKDNGDRDGTGSNLDLTYTVPESKNNTIQYLQGFYERHSEVTTFAVGVSDDINAEDSNASQSPVVLRKMAELGNGKHIGVRSDFNQLIEELRRVIEAAVCEVTVEDSLSSRMELVADRADYRVSMEDRTTGEEVVLWENGGQTGANGSGESKILESLSYDQGSRTIVLKFNESYELKDDVTYTLSYNIKVNDAAKEAYETSGYDHTGDSETDFGDNATSSKERGFHSNTSAHVSYNGDQIKYFPHPVVQAETPPGVELPFAGGGGTGAMRGVGALLVSASGLSILRRKRRD